MTVLSINIFYFFFINWEIGIFGFALSIIGILFSIANGAEFTIDNVGQIVKKMVKENYILSRRFPKTININEVETILLDLFEKRLGINSGEIQHETKFN